MTVNVTVLGAGVVGLTTAMLLSTNSDYSITVVAKHMPGDYDVEYASSWAGANYEPVGRPGSNLARFERNTWADLEKLARNVPEAGIHFQKALVYSRQKDTGSTTNEWYHEAFADAPWWKDLVPDFQNVPKDELPVGVDSANSFTSVCINVMIYLPWLVGQCLKNGVRFKRGVAKHIADAAQTHHSKDTAQIVVNCTGLASRRLDGVQDRTVFPGRGQVVVVRNEPDAMYAISGTDDGPDENAYIMHRAAGGGTILGGCAQEDNWESQPDPNLAIRIMKRCVQLCPALTGGKGIEALSVIRHGVGLRPMRQDGPRVEKERIGGLWVVHNYGHGGYGYQSSYGSAAEAKELVDSIVKERARL